MRSYEVSIEKHFMYPKFLSSSAAGHQYAQVELTVLVPPETADLNLGSVGLHDKLLLSRMRPESYQ